MICNEGGSKILNRDIEIRFLNACMLAFSKVHIHAGTALNARPMTSVQFQTTCACIKLHKIKMRAER